jgi:hypothetical protein
LGAVKSTAECSKKVRCITTSLKLRVTRPLAPRSVLVPLKSAPHAATGSPSVENWPAPFLRLKLRKGSTRRLSGPV